MAGSYLCGIALITTFRRDYKQIELRITHHRGQRLAICRKAQSAVIVQVIGNAAKDARGIRNEAHLRTVECRVPVRESYGQAPAIRHPHRSVDRRLFGSEEAVRLATGNVQSFNTADKSLWLRKHHRNR